MVKTQPVNNEVNFELIPAGSHQAVCVKVYDIGIQKTEYQGKELIKRQVIIQWILNEKRSIDGKLFICSKKYTNSLHEKSGLLRDLLSWGIKLDDTSIKEGFELDDLIGKNCLLTFAHITKGGKTYSNIVSISALPKQIPPFTATLENKETPEWIQKLIDLGKQNRVPAKEPVQEDVQIGNSIDSLNEQDVPF